VPGTSPADPFGGFGKQAGTATPSSELGSASSPPRYAEAMQQRQGLANAGAARTDVDGYLVPVARLQLDGYAIPIATTADEHLYAASN